MNAKNLGCLSTSGLMAAAITLLVVGTFAFFRGGRLFSPGPLNAQAGSAPLGGVSTHEEIGGRCGACHSAYWGPDRMSDRCVNCHTEVSTQLAGSDGLHGVLATGGQSMDCRRCHTEHQGASASLTHMDLATFPHEALGFALAAHGRMVDGSAFSCQDCHGEDLTGFDPQRCADCHQDIDRVFAANHRQTFGTACLNCHDGLDTYGKSFDHNIEAFPLEGRHAGLGCESCHRGAVDLVSLQETPADCYGCHAQDDAHAGGFGVNCAACHSPDDWEDARIDHDLTGFPLLGLHAEVECQECHVGGLFAGTPQDCVACHARDDAHNGGFGTDCAACHSPDGWEDAKVDHNLTAFPLTGAHISVACTSCHQEDVFRGTPTACNACHAEPVFHLGLFAAECETCHTTTTWRPAQFNLAHTFPLNHGGQLSTCATCHPTVLQEYTCYGCHEHEAADIQRRHVEEGISNFQDCTRCHPTGTEEGEGGEGDD